MDTRHTRGKWRAEGWENVTVNSYHVDFPMGFVTIVACPGGSPGFGLAEVKANARLIAAAPDLAAALAALVAWGREEAGPGEDLYEMVEAGLDALESAGVTI